MEQAGIVVVHKNKTLRSHLVNFLKQEGLKILADFDSLAELRANARASNPGVILLDLELLRDESEGYLEDLKRALPEVKLVLTGPDPQAHYSRHIGTLGADLYLSEGLDPRAWTRKLKEAAAGEFATVVGLHHNPTAQERRSQKKGVSMKKIDLETHFYTKDYQNNMFARKEMPREEMYKGFVRLWYEPNVWESHGVGVEDRLLDIAEGRLKDMDEAGIDIQVLSLSTPGCEQFSPDDGTAWSKKTNDQLSKAVKKHPDRFIGLCALAPQNPEEAVKELVRAVKELGLKGIKLNSHIGATYLDDKRYWPILKKAEELEVPLYLHPTTPHPSMLKPYTDYGYALTGPSLGFGAETAVHAMRMIYSGVFDEFPKLKVIIGHLGEGLLFWMYRIDFGFVKPWVDEELQPKIKKRPSEYIRNNFFVTTSGMFAMPAFMSVFLEIGADRMMFASDYPYETCTEAANFIENVVAVSDIDRKKICYQTAEKLFKLS